MLTDPGCEGPAYDDGHHRHAAVQATPVFCDRDATIEKVGGLTKEAAGQGAALVAFPEAFVPTYPDWVWRTTPWADGDWYARLADQCVDVPGPGVRRARRDRGRERVLPRDPGERARRRHDLQHDPATSVPTAASSPSTASSCRPAANGSCGARATARRSRRSTRRSGASAAHLLGELHAARARGDVRADIDICLAPTWDNSDVWVPSMRHIAKEGRLLRARHQPRASAAPTCPPTSPAATRSTAATTTGCRAATR